MLNRPKQRQIKEAPRPTALREAVREESFGRPPADEEPHRDEIAQLAYELYEKRGRKSGHEMADWLEAERIVKQKTS